MADSTDDDVSMRSVTNRMAKGDSIPGAAEQQANFIRAVGIGLNDLSNGREFSFGYAVIRLGLDRVEVSYLSPSRHTMATTFVVHCSRV